MSLISNTMYNDKVNFWMDDYTILYKNGNYTKFFPKYDMTRTEQLNAITRLCIYITILILIFSKNKVWITLPITVIVLVVIFYNINNMDARSKHREFDKIYHIRKLKEALEKKKTKEELKEDADPLEYDLATSDDKNYDLETGVIDFDGHMNIGPKSDDDLGSLLSEEGEKMPLTVQEVEEYRKATCRMPSLNNPYMNPDLTEYNLDVPAACNVNDDEVKEESKVFFNHDLFRNVDDLWEKKNSQRQFYTMPNTTIPNNQIEFAKWLYKSGPVCKSDTGACDRWSDLRYSR